MATLIGLFAFPALLIVLSLWAKWLNGKWPWQ